MVSTRSQVKRAENDNSENNPSTDNPIPIRNSRGTQTDMSRESLIEWLREMTDNSLTDSFVSCDTVCGSTPVVGTAAPSSPTTTPPPPPPTPSPAADPVRFLKLNFELPLNGLEVLTNQCDFVKEGTRRVANLGEAYSYGSHSHPATPFPSSGLFHEIREALLPLFPDVREYSCLVNLYEGGSATIPWHSDDEETLIAGSNIICVSVGCTRKLQFRSITGTKQVREYEIEHGSVYVMSAANQRHWEHRIPEQPGCQGSRLSLTFRKLAPPPPPRRIPSIREPNRPKKQVRRVLYLSDSVFGDIGAGSWGDIEVVRRPLYQIAHIEQFEHMFEHTEHVVIAAGVNDMSRYGHRGYSLGEHMDPILERLVTRYPRTTFTICAPLLTTYHWLNRDIEEWTNHVFHLSNLGHMRNLLLLDMCEEGIRYMRRVGELLDRTGNGIHLTHRAKGELREIVKEHVMGQTTGRRCRPWALRPAYWRWVRENKCF